MWKKLICLFTLAALSGPPCFASSLPEARAAFASGDLKLAARSGEALGTLDGLLIASEALSADVMLGHASDPYAQSGQAKALAARALALAPDSAEAKIQFALASGFEARTAGVWSAWRRKLPENCKAAIDEAFIAAPDDARPWALAGAWHLGLVRKAGEKRAKNWYGANLADGLKGYEEALTRAPDDMVIIGNYVITILAIDPEAHKARSAGLLAHMAGLSPKNAVEAEVQKRMLTLIPLLDKPEALAAQTTLLMDDPAIEE